MTEIALVTGASSGLGRLTFERLERQRPDWSVFATGRSRPPSLKLEPGQWITADLAAIADARKLAMRLVDSSGRIALLVLAAGYQTVSDTERSADGYERTFAVNVLANLVILDTLIAAGRTPERVILFSSGTHDPAKRAGLPPPRHADGLMLAYPERDSEATADKMSVRGARAYSASKLMVTMLTYIYAREHPAMRIDALDPQLTPGTGLARRQSATIRLLWHSLLPAITPLVPFMNKPSAVADAAVQLALDTDLPRGSGRYVEVRRGKLVEGRSSDLSYSLPDQERLIQQLRMLASS